METLSFEHLPSLVNLLSCKIDRIEMLLIKINNENNLKMKENNQQTDLMTIKEASKLLDLSIPTIYSKVSRRELPYHKQAGGKRLFFSRTELTGLIKEGRVKTATEIYNEGQ
jgi:excisionase family DNA binding protein